LRATRAYVVGDVEAGQFGAAHATDVEGLVLRTLPPAAICGW